MSFKKVKVVMLSTNEKANLYLHETKGLHLLAAVEHKSGSYSGSNQHLYFLSDEEIKVGDWMFHNLDKKPIQWNGEETESNPSVYDYKKIIATTDSKLSQIVKRDWMGKLDAQSLQDSINNKMPQPSQSFIEKFVEEYNKGNVITEVMVEWEYNSYSTKTNGELTADFKLKINPKDNTITIRKVKDSWSKEEVVALFYKNIEDRQNSKISNYQGINKWIEENL